MLRGSIGPVSYTHLDVYKRQKLTGASFGLQAGVQSADVILVFRSERGLDNIVNGKFTLGADAGVAAGCLLYTSRCV